MQDLTVRDKMTLDFEGGWWKYPGAKETAIRATFGETATRYYQRLNALVDRPEALAYAPMTVRRLQRVREQHHPGQEDAPRQRGVHGASAWPA